jgi:hypothetical protein
MRRPRLWLCLPPVVLCLLDGAITLYGQPAAYWTGGYTMVREGNPLAAWLLTVHPLAFAASAVPYLFLVLILICFLPRRGAVVVAVLVSLAHLLALAIWGLVLCRLPITAVAAHPAAQMTANRHSSWHVPRRVDTLNLQTKSPPEKELAMPRIVQ